MMIVCNKFPAHLVLDLADARASLADEGASHAVRDEELEPEAPDGRAPIVVGVGAPVSDHPSAGSRGERRGGRNRPGLCLQLLLERDLLAMA